MLVAVLGCLSQLIQMVIALLSGVSFWGAFYGALLAGVIIPVLLRRKIRLHTVELGALLAASAGQLVQLVHAFSLPAAPAVQLYMAGVFLFLMAFNLLPIRWAGIYSALLYALYIVLTVRHSGDVSLLVDLAVAVMLIALFCVFGERVSAERAFSLTYQQQALTDTLTGLENRRSMYQRLERAILRSQAGHSTAIFLLDLDHFKLINDRYGHPVGDQVLQGMAAVLKGTLRQGDTVARWGGEEFLMLIECSEQVFAVQTAQRVLHTLRTSATPYSLRVTASCGVCCSDEVESVHEWLALADERLYAAKLGGRDQLRAS